MRSEDLVVARNLASVFVFGVALYTLALLWDRERVSRAAEELGFTVLKIRWAPLASWGPWHGHAFVVTYQDLEGFIHRAKCWTLGFPCDVRWHSDEIIGRGSGG